MLKNNKRIIIGLSLLLSLTGCTGLKHLLKPSKMDRFNTKSIKPLKIPKGLSTPAFSREFSISGVETPTKRSVDSSNKVSPLFKVSHISKQ